MKNLEIKTKPANGINLEMQTTKSHTTFRNFKNRIVGVYVLVPEVKATVISISRPFQLFQFPRSQLLSN